MSGLLKSLDDHLDVLIVFAVVFLVALAMLIGLVLALAGVEFS